MDHTKKRQQLRLVPVARTTSALSQIFGFGIAAGHTAGGPL
jgi:hypothetical protein